MAAPPDFTHDPLQKNNMGYLHEWVASDPPGEYSSNERVRIFV
jgi:hypothetical protein